MAIANARAVRYSTPIITPEMQAAVIEALLTADPYILSERTKAFERDFAALIGAEHAVAVSSGTAALHLALLGTGIGADDEVIVPANAYPPVADCVRLVGAIPVLVDVDERTVGRDWTAARLWLQNRLKHDQDEVEDGRSG